jgi:hypothetical protein
VCGEPRVRLDITPERVEINTDGPLLAGWPARCPGALLAGPVLTGADEEPDMTQVLAVLGDGPTEAPVIDTAAALAEIAHARVRRVSLAGDLSAERAAAPGAGRTGQSRHCAGRAGQG